MKKAIYLDERERDLARRICRWAMLKCDYAMNQELEMNIKFPAVKWFKDEIDQLLIKFEEPEP